jgi:hypothetical protein
LGRIALSIVFWEFYSEQSSLGGTILSPLLRGQKADNSNKNIIHKETTYLNVVIKIVGNFSNSLILLEKK